MDNNRQFFRTELIIGNDAVQKLHQSKVAIFGLGGVGSYVTEALARAGIGNFVLVDKDVIDITNINRQIIATHSTVGQNKVDVMESRIKDINPNANVEKYKEFFLPNSSHKMVDNTVDYIVDAIDNITAKIELVITANKENIPIISAMGTGNKLNPTLFEVSDIYKTEMCPLAKIMRKELKARGVNKLKVVYSKEKPLETQKNFDSSNKLIQGSISFVPSVAGLIIAGEVIKDLTNIA